MQELRELADRGRAVIVVTHNVLHLDLTDRVLVMCSGGRMGYFGPPDELLEFFGAADYAEVFGLITRRPRHVGRPVPPLTALRPVRDEADGRGRRRTVAAPAGTGAARDRIAGSGGGSGAPPTA